DVATDDRNIGARCRKPECSSAADSGSRSGNQQNFSSQTLVHYVTSFRLRSADFGMRIDRKSESYCHSQSALCNSKTAIGPPTTAGGSYLLILTEAKEV